MAPRTERFMIIHDRANSVCVCVGGGGGGGVWSPNVGQFPLKTETTFSLNPVSENFVHDQLATPVKT